MYREGFASAFTADSQCWMARDPDRVRVSADSRRAPPSEAVLCAGSSAPNTPASAASAGPGAAAPARRRGSGPAPRGAGLARTQPAAYRGSPFARPLPRDPITESVPAMEPVFRTADLAAHAAGLLAV